MLHNTKYTGQIALMCLFKITGLVGLVAVTIFITSEKSVSNSFTSMPSDATIAAPPCPLIGLADTLRAFNSPKNAVILDARPTLLYSIGHIQNAINIPFDNIEGIDTRILAKIRAAHEVVVYCNGMDCGTAGREAFLLLQKGVTNAYIYSGGWAEWSSCQLPRNPGTPDSSL